MSEQNAPIRVHPSQLLETIDSIQGKGEIHLTDGEVTTPFTRAVENLTIVGSENTIVRVPISFHGTAHISSLRFIGPDAGVSFPSTRLYPTLRCSVVDCLFDGCDYPIRSSRINYEDPPPEMVSVRSCSFTECFRKPNQAGVFVATKEFSRVSDCSFTDCGGGNQCHAIYSWGNVLVEGSLGYNLNVENFLDSRGPSGRMRRCLFYKVPCIASSHSALSIRECIDMSGTEYPSGVAGVGVSYSSREPYPEIPPGVLSISRCIFLKPIDRSFTIIINGEPTVVQLAENVFVDSCFSPSCAAIKLNSATRFELTANKFYDTRPIEVARSCLLLAVANEFVSCAMSTLCGILVNVNELNIFAGGGGFSAKSGSFDTLDRANELFDNKSDWKKFLDYALERVFPNE